MNHHAQLEEELERRLAEIEAEEAADPVHAALSGRTLTTFLVIAAAIAAVSWIAGAL